MEGGIKELFGLGIMELLIGNRIWGERDEALLFLSPFQGENLWLLHLGVLPQALIFEPFRLLQFVNMYWVNKAESIEKRLKAFHNKAWGNTPRKTATRNSTLKGCKNWTTFITTKTAIA